MFGFISGWSAKLNAVSVVYLSTKCGSRLHLCFEIAGIIHLHLSVSFSQATSENTKMHPETSGVCGLWEAEESGGKW